MASLISTLQTGVIELISSFTSGSGQIEASLTDNWQTIGGAFLVQGEAEIILNILALVTDPAANGTVRLYDVTDTVTGSRVISTTLIPGTDFSGEGPKVYISSKFKVYGNHMYVVQARHIGPVDEDSMLSILNVIPMNV